MAKQMKKYMAVTTASFMAVQLAACGNSETQTVEEYPTTTSTTNTLSEEQTQATNDELVSVYNSEMADACDEWQEGDDGSYKCIDEDSPYYSQHFFNGLMYATAGAMIGSAIYKSRNLKNGTDRDEQSGGGGSTVPRTTQNAKEESKTNGLMNSTQQKAGTTSGSSTPSSSNSYSSGQRSYSTDSPSKSSNSYSNSSSSSSTGKSGFGSGGASRGGSSSS